MKRIAATLLVAAAVVSLPTALPADNGHNPDPPSGAQRPSRGAQTPSDDMGLMEFLGGIGSEDDAWIDYLARTDPTKVAVAPKRTPPDASRPAVPPNGSQK